ncbi:hypothetical protein FNV43_RR07807 [Rhamnella rubrinervis]|uniref:Uncharacterized protein n=1 Tax=Rhamnella rubrinervis TaxID=2594499 RepID=A0A8K0HFE4_9ROSA|nr:hypothetical protein FNV43_RR07807 [Rhamnella rubrinervis]
MAVIMRRPFGYSKVDKEDPDEKIHRRAQFLIYKVLEKADESKRRPSYLRLRIRKLKVKIGKRLTRLRKTMLLSLCAARVCVGKQFSCRLKTCKRLFSRGERTASLTLPPLLN